eukprot:362622-Chlamydomonas_euryale.AAC.1
MCETSTLSLALLPLTPPRPALPPTSTATRLHIYPTPPQPTATATRLHRHPPALPPACSATRRMPVCGAAFRRGKTVAAGVCHTRDEATTAVATVAAPPPPHLPPAATLAKPSASAGATARRSACARRASCCNCPGRGSDLACGEPAGGLELFDRLVAAALSDMLGCGHGCGGGESSGPVSAWGIAAGGSCCRCSCGDGSGANVASSGSRGNGCSGGSGLDEGGRGWPGYDSRAVEFEDDPEVAAFFEVRVRTTLHRASPGHTLPHRTGFAPNATHCKATLIHATPAPHTKLPRMTCRRGSDLPEDDP